MRDGWIGLVALVLCLVFWVGVGTFVYHKGVVAGRQESERLFAAQVRALNRIVDHTEIKAMLSEGRR